MSKMYDGTALPFAGYLSAGIRTGGVSAQFHADFGPACKELNKRIHLLPDTVITRDIRCDRGCQSCAPLAKYLRNAELGVTVMIPNIGPRGQSGSELDAACVVYGAYVGDVAVRTDKH